MATNGHDSPPLRLGAPVLEPRTFTTPAGEHDETSVSIVAQVGIQATGLSFRCICHLGNPIKTRFESGFCLLCTSHGSCCLSPYHQVWEIWLCRSVVEYCYKAGRKPATCRACGKTFPRPNVTLSDFFTVKSDKKKGNNSRNVSRVTSRRSRNTSPAMSRRSSVVSWSDSPRDQAVPKSEEAVMGYARSLIRLKSTGRLERTTHCEKFSRTCQMNTNRSSTRQSLDDEKVKWPYWTLVQ